MDYIDTKDLTAIAIQINTFAFELKNKLIEQAKAKVLVDKLLSEKMPGLIQTKKNVGIDSAIVLSLADEKFANAYNDYMTSKASCDGLKAVIEALSTQIMLAQSLMKFTQKEIN